MRLTTVQPYEVLENLRSSGRFVCDITKSSLASSKDCVFSSSLQLVGPENGKTHWTCSDWREVSNLGLVSQR